jgi:hypothetical protein
MSLATIARIPGLFVSSWIGANASAVSPPILVLIGAGAVGLALVVQRYREEIEDWLANLAARLSREIRRRN